MTNSLQVQPLNELTKKLSQQVSLVLGQDVSVDTFEIANPKVGAHLALPCFSFAKQLKRSPADIAADVAQKIPEDSLLQRCGASGPYVNFWLNPDYMVKIVQSVSDTVLKDKSNNGQTVVVEYLSQNLAKPLSIGHLRNLMQGKVIALNYQNQGYKVITDNHVGDWGTVFGMWVVGFKTFSSEEQLRQDGVEELGRVYVQMRQALKAEQDQGSSQLADLVQEWLLKLEDNDQEALEYHKKFSQISLEAGAKQVAELGVVFDHNYGESFFVQRGKQMIGELLESGIARQNDDGSVIVPLDRQGMDTPMLIQKSNGAALYHTSDIATIEWRVQEWNPDIVVYVVGAEQQFHFKQLFAANNIAKWSSAELVHHWYGLIEELDESGKRRKMSSRSNAVYMKDLLDLALQRAQAIAPKGLSVQDIKKIAYGAIFFREFSSNHQGNVLFDWDEMFSLSGYSGPYVQYAAVRIKSILSEAPVGDKHSEVIADHQSEEAAALLWTMLRFQSVVDQAASSREFHPLAGYAYELAKNWNRYYEKHQVIGAGAHQTARLELAKLVLNYLERTLKLIGVEVPSKM